jgi:hypothetical protein
MSPNGLATSMAPSRLLTIIRATSVGEPSNPRVASSLPCSRTRVSHASFSAAETHLLHSKHVEIQADISIKTAGCVLDPRFHRRERFGEARRVAIHECLSKLSLPGEVVVEGRRRDFQFCGNIGVADGVEAAYLDLCLGRVKYACCSFGPIACVSNHRRHPKADLLTLTY